MLFSFCKSIIPEDFKSAAPQLSFPGVKTRFKAFLQNISKKKAPAGRLNDPFYKIFKKKEKLWVDLRSLLQIIYDIGTGFLIFHCFATKMLLLFCKSMIPVWFCTVFPLHSCAGIKTRLNALLKTQYLTLGPNF